jgi:chorismate synthase
MSANSFGSRIQMHTFGESHGRAVGVLLDGFPAGISIDLNEVQNFLERRRPGTSSVVSQRKEKDKVELVSGIFEDKTLGTPICGLVYNQNARSEDYDDIKTQPRHGHADKVWKEKFGHIDHRGGGRSSGRETLSRVIAGALCDQALRQVAPKMEILGFVSQIGQWTCEEACLENLSRATVDQMVARFPHSDPQFIQEKLESAITNGESYGGIAEILIKNPPKSLGQPVFHKLKTDLAAAAMSLGATLGVDFAEGFESIENAGTQFHSQSKVSQYGGIQGGISTGETIRYRVYFKPTSSILDVAKKGRHDPCIVPRAVPVLEAMTAFILFDHILWQKTDKLEI